MGRLLGLQLRRAVACGLALSLCFVQSQPSFEGIVADMAVLTDATAPPAIRTFSTKTMQVRTILEYTLPDLERLGVPPLDSLGRNRTLRPAGIVLLEERYVDTIYWADPGAGAILGMRFDSSGLRVLAHGLKRPEPMAIDSTDASYIAAGGTLLCTPLCRSEPCPPPCRRPPSRADPLLRINRRLG